MKTFYSINGYWTHKSKRVPEFCGLYATRKLAEEAFHKLTARLDKQGYEYWLYITEVPLNETSEEVDTLVNHFHDNMKRKQKDTFVTASYAVNVLKDTEEEAYS